jgi:hypothetical protein
MMRERSGDEFTEVALGQTHGEETKMLFPPDVRRRHDQEETALI